MKRSQLGISNLSFSSCKSNCSRNMLNKPSVFIAFQSEAAVSEINSASTVEQQVLEDNQQRCDFFKEFKDATGDRLGAVSD